MRGAGGFYKGTNTEQTPYFGDKEKKLIEKMTWPEIYNQKIDLTKINLDVVGKWIHKRLIEILGFEDDILYEYCVSQLRLDQEGIDDESENFLNSKRLKINLTGFIGNKKSEVFLQELLELLISNEQNEMQIVESEMEAKRIEIEQVRKENELLQRNIQNLRSIYTENTNQKDPTPVEKNANGKTDDPNGRPQDPKGRPQDRSKQIDGDSPKRSDHIHNRRRKKPTRCSTPESSRSTSELDKHSKYKRRKNKIYVNREKHHSDEDTSNGGDEEERDDPDGTVKHKHRRELDTANGRGSVKEFDDDSTRKSSKDSNAKEIHSIMKRKSYNSMKKGLRAWSPSESDNG
ncbi:splicing factor, partial [Plasmodium cynomolgi strain B]